MKLNYMQRIQLGAQFFGDEMPPGVFEVMLSHDNSCNATKGKECSCTPDIDVTVGSRRFKIDEEGVMHEKTNVR